MHITNSQCGVAGSAQGRCLIARFLGLAGYRVVAAPGGETAWQLIQATGDGFDLIVTNSRMPAMDGLELIRRVKDPEPLQRVLRISASTAEERAGGRSVPPGVLIVPKPFGMEELLSAVRLALARE